GRRERRRPRPPALPPARGPSRIVRAGLRDNAREADDGAVSEEDLHMTATLRARSEIPVEDTWDVGSIFPGDAGWEAECDRLAATLPELDRFHGRLAQGADVLAELLAASERVSRSLDRVLVYAIMRSSVDATDETAAALADRARGLGSRVQAALAFVEPELLAVGVETLRRWVADHEPLAVYAHWVELLGRRAPHVRSAEVEEVLGLAAEPLDGAASVHGVLANADLRFRQAVGADGGEREVAQGVYNELLASPDRELRRTAWESYTDAHLATARTMAACLATAVKRDAFLARARRYRDSLDAALSPNHIPVEVFHNVIDALRDHAGTWHRYWRLRRRALGLDALREYDTRAPLACRVEVGFRQAVEWISDGMAPLGEDYVDDLRRGVLEQRWVDAHPNRGKRQGAFSIGRPGTRPFVFMSYGGSLGSMSTLAHELGHSMHNLTTSRSQPYVYSRYGLFLAEVASNFNQALVRAHLLARETDPALQVALLEEGIGNFHRYLLVMPTLSRFELEIHDRVERGEPLTAEGMTELMAGLLAEVYGPEVEMDRRRSGILWAQFSGHLYRGFYPYQYATGIAAAHALADGVLAEGRPAAERYRRFLATGGSMYPLDALRLAGVDMATREPLDRGFAVLARYVDRLEELVG
ncbi:MAG TPA: oligoendopeptidase F, partial [Candidatus Eisenbacteria bacterium]|nr:oligoendopeptidase F [Candidatus Eisenbacteria bacterium]